MMIIQSVHLALTPDYLGHCHQKDSGSLKTPLETQILFDCFINRESLRRSSQPEDFLHQKFEKLYFVYDILLNVYKKNFIGVLQQSNTQ